MQVPAAPKGTRDFYPDQIGLRERIFASWALTCRRHGFELYDAPMFEHLELYTQKSGPEIEKQLYSFKDKAGRDLALRPELTPSLARMVAARGTSLKRPIRWYSIPKLFRYERMQKGRLREFFQLNMDILGVAEVTADAELIAAAVDMMRDLGFTAEDFTIHVSSRMLLEELLLDSNVPSTQAPAIYAALDRRHKVPEAEFDAELLAASGSAAACECVKAVMTAKNLDDVASINNALPSLATLRELFSLMGSYGMSDFVTFDIGIVRGLAYYTGVVFEVFDKKRSMRAIAGGGRWDRLVRAYGGPDTPAVGFAAGDVVLADLLTEKGIVQPPAPRCDAFVVAFDDAYPHGAITLVQALRRAGIPAEFALRRTGVGNQMKLADAARARVVVFCGGDEGKAGCVKVKTMASGAEEVVAAGEVADAVRRRVTTPT